MAENDVSSRSLYCTMFGYGTVELQKSKRDEIGK
jgi:hypothetical protein